MWKDFNREKGIKCLTAKCYLKIKIIMEKWLVYCEKKIHTNLKRKSYCHSIKLGFYNISLLLDLQKYFCTLQIPCYSLSSVLDENRKDHINLWIGMFACISYFSFHSNLVNCIIRIFNLIIFFPSRCNKYISNQVWYALCDFLLEVIQRQYRHCHLISFFEENLFCLRQQRSPTKVQ